jgi:hypothetical protein
MEAPFSTVQPELRESEASLKIGRMVEAAAALRGQAASPQIRYG